VQEVLLGLSGAAIAVRMTRHVASGEPLLVSLRRYVRLVLRYGVRLVLVFLLATAVTAAAALILAGVAGLKAMALPAGSLLLLVKQGLVVLLTVLVFAFVSGRLHLWLAAAALDRTDLDFKAAWGMGCGCATPVVAGMLAFYLPGLALDLAILRVVAPDSGIAVTLPAFVIEAAANLLLTAALASYFARLFKALAPVPTRPAAVADAAQPA
jgi:hypothetical protein